ncbi:MAG: amino acid ABC transporter substrate-binding protein [Phycisphaerales bacterium]|nr:MAG: amino acid ABC transporter substrate-binding protein [Phycisphaerales bacterium]
MARVKRGGLWFALVLGSACVGQALGHGAATSNGPIAGEPSGPAGTVTIQAADRSGSPPQASPGAEPPPDKPTMTVATTITPPFVFRGEDGTMRGIDVDLWERIARRLGVQTRWVEMTVPQALKAVQDGSADAAMAALTISRPREEVMDFSHAYFSSGLGIAVSDRKAGAAGMLLSILGALFSVAFLQAVGALAVVLLVSGLLVWLFERKANAQQFKAGLRGLGDGFWWSAVTMTTVGYGDKAPVTLGGRLVALVWMFTSIIIIAAFTGSIASAITVGALEGAVRGPEDLPRVRVGALEGTTAWESLAERGVRPVGAESIQQAIELLKAGRVDAVVHDAPVLLWVSRHEPGVRVLEATFEPQNYGIALPQGSRQREAINQALLAELESQDWQAIQDRYLQP